MINERLYQVLFGRHPFVKNVLSTVSKKELMSFLNSKLYPVSFSRRRILLSAGEIPDKVFFVSKGLARGFFYDEKKDKESTLYLWDTGSFCTDVNNFITDQQCTLNIEVFPDSQLLCLSKADLQEVFARFPATEVFIKCLMLQEASHLLEVSNDLMRLSAWERYLKLLKRYPRIELMISKEIIASCLTITPQSLSRMIKENGHP